jgi:hypothetical protein
MLVVVAVNLSVALKANGYRVLYFIATVTFSRDNVIRFDFYAAESMADAAAPMAARKQSGNFVSCEGHVISSV